MPILKGKMKDIGGRPELVVAGHAKITFGSGLSPDRALSEVVQWIHAHDNNWNIIAAGHRIVHGGEVFSKPVVLDNEVLKTLQNFVSFAPLHMPYNLMGVETLKKMYPDIRQIGCFDTAFHAGLSALHYSYALPSSLREQGIRKYGFHGLSYEWVMERIREELPNQANSRIVAAHLGNGASLCAIKNGKSVDTTMGMTALDGLPMGTRSGAVDPGIVLHMINEMRMSASGVENILSKNSGLKGLSGISNDVRLLRQSDNPDATFALRYFAFKVAQHTAQMAVSLGGLDLLVFTGGIGENDERMRESIIRHLSPFGSFATHIVKCNEERVIARHTQRLLSES